MSREQIHQNWPYNGRFALLPHFGLLANYELKSGAGECTEFTALVNHVMNYVLVAGV
jgi:hypothetical protein